MFRGASQWQPFPQPPLSGLFDKFGKDVSNSRDAGDNLDDPDFDAGRVLARTENLERLEFLHEPQSQ